MHNPPTGSAASPTPQPNAVLPEVEMIVTLHLSGEVFGIPVVLVHEIMDPITVTQVPNAPPEAPGLINVRGAVVPLLDLRYRLGMPELARGAHARIVVIETLMDGAPLRLAIMADSVDEVLDITAASIDPIPNLGATWPEAFIRGALRHGENLVVLLNPDTVFRPDPLNLN